MKKSRLLGTVCASIFTFVNLFLVSTASASSILVSDSGAGSLYGYGEALWTNMTAALDAASGNGVDVAPNFENLSQMLTYDALWLDQRGPSGSLTANEISNISSFIGTGRRVVMMGENFNWAAWNNQILGIVGSSFAGDGSSSTLTTILSNDITAGVSTVYAIANGTADVAASGTALFNINTVTLWGAGNVLTMLDVDICRNSDWTSNDNAVFCGNVASWISSGLPATVPLPAAAWLFGSGLLGLIGVARKKEYT